MPDQPILGTIDRKLYENVPNPPGPPGNQVTLDHGNDEYSDFGHMQRGSVRVKAGDRVKQGDVLGQVGTSESPFPHLHYQFQSFKDQVSLHISLTDCPHALRMCPSICMESL